MVMVVSGVQVRGKGLIRMRCRMGGGIGRVCWRVDAEVEEDAPACGGKGETMTY